jgi:hypothetical protein
MLSLKLRVLLNTGLNEEVAAVPRLLQALEQRPYHEPIPIHFGQGAAVLLTMVGHPMPLPHYHHQVLHLRF